MRNPEDPGWPERGERTELEEIADRWKWAYLALVRGEHRRRVLDLGPEPMPLSEAIEEYLTHRSAQVERSTWGNDRTAVNHLKDHVGASTSTVRIGPKDIQALMDDMIRQGYRVTTLKTYLRSMRVFFKWLGGHGPTDGVTLPKPAERDVIFWTKGEVAVLRDAADKVDAQEVRTFPSARLALELGLCMGLRQGEIFGARWEDISRATESMRVQRQVPKDRTKPRHLKSKKAGTVFVHPDWWDHHCSAIGYIVGDGEGGCVGTRTQRNMITRILDTAGLNGTGIGWHSLRHTYARRHLEGEGVPAGSLEELRNFLRHASIVTTEQRYGHFREDEAVRRARERRR